MTAFQRHLSTGDRRYSYKFRFRGQQILRVTEYTNARDALVAARAHRRLLIDGHQEAADQLRRRRAPGAVDLAAIKAAYLGAPPAPKRADPATRAKFWARLESLIVGAGQPLEGFSLERLTGDLVYTWKQTIEARAALEADDPERVAQIYRSGNGVLRQAKSVFSADFREYYTKACKLTIPATLGTFLSVPMWRGCAKQDYHPPNDAIVRATLADLDAKATTDPNLFRAVWLAIGFGLRASEITAAKVGWFQTLGGICWLVGDKLAKNKRFPRIRAQLGAWDKLRPHIEGRSPDEYVLTGTDAERTRYVMDRIAAWMTGRGWRTQHHLHEWRAWGGCQIAMHHPDGLRAAQAHLRHASATTTEKHYGHYLRTRDSEVTMREVTAFDTGAMSHQPTPTNTNQQAATDPPHTAAAI